MKTFIYIDGFNLYHSLVRFIEQNKQDSKVNDSYKWLDIKKMINFHLDKNDEIQEINFFSAIPTHKDQNKIKRHKKYMRVLSLYLGIEVILGRFGEKKINLHCRHCKNDIQELRHEEKETDVSIGIKVVHDIHKKNVEKIVLVTNDTDFIPIIKYILEETNKKILILLPLGVQKTGGAFSEIKRINPERFVIKKIKQDIVTLSRLPKTIEINKQQVKSPYTAP